MSEQTVNRGSQLSDPLDEGERERFAGCTEVIKTGAKTFLTVGNAILAVHCDSVTGKPLYREKHKNLQEYLDATVGATLGRRMAYHLIEAAKTENARLELAPDLPAPTSERSLRPVSGMEPEARVEILREATEIAKENGRNGYIEDDTRAAKERYLKAQDPARRENNTVRMATETAARPKTPFAYIEPSSLRVDAAGRTLYLTVMRPPNKAQGQTKPHATKNIPLLVSHLEALGFTYKAPKEEDAFD